MNTTNTSNLIKIQYNNDIRKFRVENNSFENFVNIVQIIYQLKNKDELKFFYIENGEKIHFGSDVEFSEALSTIPARFFVEIETTNQIVQSDDKIPICKVRKLSAADGKNFLQLKEQMKEINQKILAKKEEVRSIKKQSKEKITSGNNEIVNDDRMKLFKFSLEIHELKSTKRETCFKIRSIFKNSNELKRADQVRNSNGDQVKNIMEMKEKSRALKIQIRAQKLLLNNFISENQKNEIEQQIRDLKTQIFQLQQEKRNFHSNQNPKCNRGMNKRGKNGGFNRMAMIHSINGEVKSINYEHPSNNNGISALNLNLNKNSQKNVRRGAPENVELLRNIRRNRNRINLHCNGPQCSLVRENTC